MIGRKNILLGIQENKYKFRRPSTVHDFKLYNNTVLTLMKEQYGVVVISVER